MSRCFFHLRSDDGRIDDPEGTELSDLASARIPHVIQMQIGGDAHRIALPSLASAVGRSESLRHTLTLFAQVHAVQVT